MGIILEGTQPKLLSQGVVECEALTGWSLKSLASALLSYNLPSGG